MAEKLVISGLIKKRAEIAGEHRAAMKVADAIKADLAAIDRSLLICGYEGDPRGIEPRGKYRQLFGRSELKRIILQVLREAPADDEAVVERVIQVKGWTVDDELHADILKRTRDAIQRAQKAGIIERDFGPDGCLWRLA